MLCRSKEDESKKWCGLECKSRCTQSTQQYEASQLMSGCSKHAKVKWDDDCLHHHIPSFHEKTQTLHHSVVYEFDLILLLIGKSVDQISHWISHQK